MLSLNLIKKGRELGFLPHQIKAMYHREKMINEVLDCENIEDIKILLLHWIEQGKIKG